MIQSLSIRNIALIEQLTISFHSGLQVLSGETGAGKSIVVDAVNLILGGRADRTMIRSGCDKASVEALFDISATTETASLLSREGIDFDGSTVSIYREISGSGKNICRICGIIMPLSFLKELAPLLMNLHGQSEHQYLADPQTHLGYLDQLGDMRHQEMRDRVRECCIRFIENHRAYARLVRRNEEKDYRMEKIRKDLEELHQAELKPGEEDALREEIKQMESAGKVSEGLKKAYHSLISGEGEGGALQLVREAARQMKSLGPRDEDAETMAGKCESLYYDLEDLAYQINSRIEKLDFDPVRAEQAENRLELIRRLEKRFGSTVDEVIQKENELEKEFAELCGLEDEIKKMSAEHKRLLAEYRSAARELSGSRKKLAEKFSVNMMRELHDLGMDRTVFEVRFAENEDGKPKMPTETGDDQVEFMICPNPGEPLLPLARIASGGELSRLMLAMKTLEAGHSGIDCMVFDEIDTGISGKAAQTVAEKLITISRYHQVICVSHLPQLASAGDYQYLVSKKVENGRTVTGVSELDYDGRVAEIARMISGADGITDDARQYAGRMLGAAEKKKGKTTADPEQGSIRTEEKPSAVRI